MTETMTLADLRKKAGLSQLQMAERLGVQKAAISKIEAMYPDVLFSTLRRYMDVLDVEIRFHGVPDVASISSSEVVKDESRIMSEKRRTDPKRGRRVP
jgi:transcriptional regulator with XRE-family HTH domain